MTDDGRTQESEIRHRQFVVAVPTLRRYDLLQECLRSVLGGTVRPREVFVLDNGGTFIPDDGLLASGCPIEVERPAWNLGVAGSWNRIHRRYADAAVDVVIMDDDVVVGPDVLERLVAAPQPFVTAISAPEQAWSLFLQREPVWQAVGEYDDGFWPGHFEDDDYRHRMRLGGFDVAVVADHAGVVHQGGATVGALGVYRHWARRRYVSKWGGEPGHETFDVPWDSAPHSERALYYRNACDHPSDINEHCPTLALLAHGCDHVTELGTRTGVSTTAFLFAQPSRLVCYDLVRMFEVDNLFRIAGRTAFELRLGDSREVTIEETDLLFIDTFHVYEQMAIELRRHAGRVRRYIAMHDTTTFGESGEAPGSRGIWPAVSEFLAASPEWMLLARYTNNHGLTVLARRGDAGGPGEAPPTS